MGEGFKRNLDLAFELRSWAYSRHRNNQLDAPFDPR